MTTLPPPKPHPRLFISDAEFADLKTRVQSDDVLRRVAECLRRKADQFYHEPVVTYKKEGRRLLGVCRSAMERILAFAATARLQDDPRYVRRAVQEMLAIAAFGDWNPSHFLDVAEMTFGVAVGYDWLYNLLSDDERKTIATALLEKGIKPSLDESNPENWWIKGRNNWNQVCHCGMVVGALASQEHDPALTARIIERATKCIPIAAQEYAPDGAYTEGPNYWGYGTSFHVALIGALESAVGQDFGLADGPGFLESAHYIFQVQSPSGRYFNYSDSAEGHGIQPSMWWFSHRSKEPALVDAEVAGLDKALTNYESRGNSDNYRQLALVLAWAQQRPTGANDGKPATALPLNWMARGENPLGIHRSAWNDPKATYVALKGGTASASHAHMDAGVFILEADGVRWGFDLGMQDYYSIEKLGIKLFDSKQASDRWKIFRLGSQGHNVPNFNGAQQLVAGHAPIVRFQAGTTMPHTVVDLSTVYADHVTRVWRGVGLLADGRVILQDEWKASSMEVDMHWQMFTHANVAVDGNRVTLTQNDVQWQMQVLDPASGFKIEAFDKSAPAQSFDAPNPGAKLILITCKTESGQSRTLRILAARSGSTSAVPAMLPLEHWSPALSEKDERPAGTPA